MVEIDWLDRGPVITESDVARFEKSEGITLSPEHRRFLVSVTNGGRAPALMPIPASGAPYGAGDLDAIYGIGHEHSVYELARACEFLREKLPGLVPFAYDEGNGQVFIDISSGGHVVYIPWDEINNSPSRPYFVANSIAEFLEESVRLARELA